MKLHMPENNFGKNDGDSVLKVRFSFLGKTLAVRSQKKFMKQYQELKQKWTGREKIDICFA